MEPFYHDPCVLPLRFREKGNIDHKTMMGIALTRSLCPKIKDDEWNIRYDKGKYGRSPEVEFSRVVKKATRLYGGFKKSLKVRVNDDLELAESEDEASLPSRDLFSGVFGTQGEKANDLNALIRQWVADYRHGKARIGVKIPQLGFVSDLVFSVGDLTVGLETMRYVSGVRGSWTVARLRTFGALATPMELERYGLVDRGGILLGHHGQHQVLTLAEESVRAVSKIRELSIYFRHDFPVVGLVDLEKRTLHSYDLLREDWVQRDFSLLGLSSR